MPYKVFPQHLLDKETTAHLRSVLAALVKTVSIRHFAVGFVTQGGHWHFREDIALDPMKTTGADFESGLLGKALEVGKVIVYRDDVEYADAFLGVGANKTYFEVAAPIYYDGVATAGLLGDVFERELRPTLDLAELKARVADHAAQISAILDANHQAEPFLRREINAIVRRCTERTKSKRGYVAIKRVDGDLEYFDNDKTFLELSQTEGLCGYVFKAGEVLNVPDVWASPLYVASDKEIRSELVAPIKDGADTVGVLNMESTEAGHYGHDGNHLSIEGDTILRSALELSGLARRFRDLGLGDSPATDVTQELLRYDGSLDVEEYADVVGDRLALALKAESYAVWIPGSIKPHAFDGLEWNPRGGVTSQLISNDRCVICGPLRSYGEQKASIGIITRAPQQLSSAKVIEQTCRLAGEILELKRQQTNAVKMEHIIDTCLNNPTSVTLYDVLMQFKDVVGADSCSIYGRQVIDGIDYLMVAASTTTEIFNHVHSEMYYCVGKLDDGFYDGYTGYAASEQRTFHTANLSEMSAAEKEKWSKLGARWKRGMSEDGSSPITAFICEPICSADGALLGVIRLSRLKTVGNLGDFDLTSRKRLKLLVTVLGRAYAAGGFLSRAHSIMNKSVAAGS